MIRKRLAALLVAGATAVSLSAPACAVNAAGAGMLLTLGGAQAMTEAALEKRGVATTPPAQEGKSIGFYGLEKTVRTYNQTIKSLEKTLASVGATDVETPIEDQIWNYGIQLNQAQKDYDSYTKSKANLEAQLNSVQGNADLEATLKAQIAQMDALAQQADASIKTNSAIISNLEDAKDDAVEDLPDTYGSTKKQVENSANQIVMGAQTQYITLCSLGDNIAALERTIASLDRQIPVIEKQYEIGMASSLTLESIKNQRAAAASSKTTLETQIASIESSLSLTLGNSAGTTVHVQTVPQVTDRQLRSMNYEKDLEEAKTNSYTIWSARDKVRQASNDYEDDITSTLDAYNAAKINLAAAQEQVENDFRDIYNDVNEKNRLLAAAEDDLALAETNYKVAQTQYNQGMLSKNDYDDASDTLESAREAVKAAEINLFTAYNTYEWAKRGVMM